MTPNPKFSRRDFVNLCSQLGLVCACGGLVAELSAAEGNSAAPAPKKELPDLKKQACCTSSCDDRCALFKATRTNDASAKKVVFEKWKWQEKFGVEFNADQVFCYGCKAADKPVNIAHSKCTVFKCCTERGLDSCVQCQKLADCDKDLWKNYPKLRQRVQKLQQDFAATSGFKLS